MVADATPRLLTRAEYDRMAELGFFANERVELIHGTVVRMAPIGTGHCDVVDVCNELLVLRLAGRATVRIQAPFLAHDDSEPEPDVVVAPRRRYSDRHPDQAFLVIEVAESSLAYDRHTKARLYAASGVREYWIIDVLGRAVEVHRQPGSDRYAVHHRVTAGAVHPEAFPDVELSLAELFP
ncbi:MAG: Uma2 family endonuclease [Polyangiaceae bacterium]